MPQSLKQTSWLFDETVFRSPIKRATFCEGQNSSKITSSSRKTKIDDERRCNRAIDKTWLCQRSRLQRQCMETASVSVKLHVSYCQAFLQAEKSYRFLHSADVMSKQFLLGSHAFSSSVLLCSFLTVISLRQTYGARLSKSRNT